MPSRIPQQPAAESGPHRIELDVRLSAELASMVAGARRRALRDGDKQIDTAHLLHSLLESDPEVRAVFDSGPQVARLLGYLVQRSIGYGLRWQSTVEDSGAVPMVPEAGWSPAAAGAMEEACERAVLRGDERARGVDLLAVVLVDPQSRAVEVLGRAGVDIGAVLVRIQAGFEEYAGGGDAGF